MQTQSVKAEIIDSGRFTPRESQTAQLMAEGWSNKDIARLLAISIKTVDVHTASIYEKLDLRCQSINTRVTAIITMVARGMIRLSINSVVAILVLNAAGLDDHALRVAGRNHRSGVSSTRKDGDA